MHFVQTFIRLAEPPTFTLILWMLGLYFLFERPVVFIPIPPFFLGMPRRDTVPPVAVDFPHISHPLATFLSSDTF